VTDPHHVAHMRLAVGRHVFSIIGACLPDAFAYSRTLGNRLVGREGSLNKHSACGRHQSPILSAYIGLPFVLQRAYLLCPRMSALSSTVSATLERLPRSCQFGNTLHTSVGLKPRLSDLCLC
jgi:hypothetical protein